MMKRIFALFAVLAFCASTAYAQQFVRLAIDSTSDTINANGDSVALSAEDLGGFGSVKVQTLDSYSGTWEVQCALNGTDYDAAAELTLKPTDSATTATSVTDTVGIWEVTNASGCKSIRVIATAGFAATDTVVVISATQSGGSSGGGGGGGDVTNAGTFAVQESGAALTALQLIDNLVKLEDDTAGSGWAGVGVLAVRQDSQSDLAADGDFIPLTIDGDGGLRVSIISGAGSGGTALADDADFADGTTSGTPIGGVAESAAPTTVTEGDFGWAAITLNRALKVTLYNSSGTELTSGDSTTGSAAATTGPQIQAFYSDFDGSALPTPTNVNTEGEAVPLAASIVGVQYVQPVTENGAASPLAADDAAATTAGAVSAAGFKADESSTDSVDEDDLGYARMTLDRKVIVTSQPHTAGGLTVFMSTDLDETEEDVKGSAGQIYAMWVTNNATASRYVRCYNDTAANVTVGTTARVFEFEIPGNSSDDVAAIVAAGGHGIPFSTAISCAATTGAGSADTGAPGANDIHINVFYK